MNNSKNEYAQQKIAEAFKQSNASNIYSGRQKNPEGFEVIVPKMVKGEQTRAAIEDQDSITNRDHDLFLRSSLSESITRIRDNRNILELLPDTKLAIEIIIGTMLAPKDMSRPTLTYKLDSNIFNHTSAVLTNYIQDYFKNTYKLEDKLETMLWDILANTGSYPIAVLPETAVDYMINSNAKVTLESLKLNVFEQNDTLPSMGYVGVPGNGAVPSFEDMSILDYMSTPTGTATQITKEQTVLGDPLLGINIVDNFDALKFPLLQNKITRQNSSAAVEKARQTVNRPGIMEHRVASTESLKVLNPSDFKRTELEKRELAELYPDRQFVSTPILRVRTRDTLKRETTGHPLILKLPTEAVIPVYSPNDVREHIGYFVALDPAGNPIRISELDNMYRMLQTSSNAVAGGAGVMSFLLQSSQNANAPSSLDVSKMGMMEGLSRASYIYQEMVEKQLLERIALGNVGSGYSLGNLETPMLMMLSRALAGKRTQMLYVPVDVLSYLAVNYDNFGLGKTLLDDSKLLASLRSMNMIVNSIASSKNAITKRVLDVALDPAEKNPQKALKVIVQEYVKGTQGEYPLTNNPVDQVNYLQMAGVQVRTQDHPRMPSTNVGVDYLDNNYKAIDTTYDDWLKKLHMQGIGISPEIIEGAGSADFATQAVLANALTARRIDLLSKKFGESLSEFLRTYIFNSAILMDGLLKLIRSNKIRLKHENGLEVPESEVLIHVIRALSVVLPNADTTKVKEQKEAFDTQSDFYEAGIRQFYSDEWLTEAEIGKLGGMEAIQRNSKYMHAYFMRKWMKENGVANELFDIIGVDAEGKPLIDFAEEKDAHMSGIARALMGMTKRDMKRSGDINAELEKFEGGLTNPPGEDNGGGGYGGNDYSSSPQTSFDDSSNEWQDLDADMSEQSTEQTEAESETETPEGESNNSDGQGTGDGEGTQ